MAHETIELTEVQAILDGLSSPTDEEFVQAVRAYSDGAVASAAAKNPQPEHLSAQLIRFVDYQRGSDSSHGLKAAKAKKTIQAAYDDLKSVANGIYTPVGANLGIGTIVVLPGDHDVGAGVVIDYNRPVEIVGYRNGSGYTAGNSVSRIKTSSAAATEMILTGSLSAVTYGNRFHGLSFLVQTANSALTAVIRARANTHLDVQHNLAYHLTLNKDIPFLEQHPGGSAQDNAWLKLLNNTVSGLPLYHSLAGGTNYNRGIIGWNNCIFGGGATFPMLWLDGDFWNNLVIANNLEGGTSGAHIEVGSVTSAANGNVFIQNMGEAVSSADAFYHVVNGGWNDFFGGSCTSSSPSTNGTWIEFETAGYPNRVYGQFDYVGQTGFKRKVVDGSTYPASNIIHGRGGRIHYQKSAASPSFSASDFVTIPPDGTIVGTTVNTGSGEKRLWMVANGAYVSVVVA